MPRKWIIALAGAILLIASAAVGYAAGDVQVEGNRFYRDGVPWVAEGVTLVSRVSTAAETRGRPAYASSRAEFGPSMLVEVRRFGADLVRFQVSQDGLDPKSQIYDPKYPEEVLTAVRLARASGFNVIVSMRWQKRLDPSGLPSATTRRAWREIAPALAEDRGVMLEIFNESSLSHANPKDWKKWKAGMQPLIYFLRRQGSKNVLLVGGVQYSRSLENAPVLEDPLGQLGYAVHPFLGPHNQTRADWQRKFGDFAEVHPVMATAFNAQAGGGYCRPELPGQAEALLAYLHEKQIGLVAWALDMPNLREPDGSYTTLDNLVCGKRSQGGQGGAGQMIHEYFLQN